MYVRPGFRGRGLGKMMLDHLSAYARSKGMQSLLLQTGVYQTEAIRLYERMEFMRTAPFGEYGGDPLCLYYQKILD